MHRNFLHQFITYFKACKIYPPGHHRQVEQLSVLCEAARRILLDRTEITILVDPEGIHVCGETFDRKDKSVATFIPVMITRLIRYLVIESNFEDREFDALMDLVQQTPETLQKRGGAVAVLENLGVQGIRLFEFAYDMNNYAKERESLKTARVLARYAKGEEGEKYIQERMKELELSPAENQKLQFLLEEEEVREKLDIMHRLMGQVSLQIEDEVHTSDMLCYMVKGLQQMEGGLEDVESLNLSKVFAHIFDQVNHRLATTLEDDRHMPQRDILDRVAQQTVSSPEALLQWLSLDPDRLSRSLSSDQAGMLRCIFSQPKDGVRRIKFGNTELKTMGKIEKSTEKPSIVAPWEEMDTQSLDDMAVQFLVLQEKNGSPWESFDLKEVPDVHLNVLMELLFHEDDDHSRIRILDEVGRFLTRCVQDGGKEGKALFLDWLPRSHEHFSREDRVRILKSYTLSRECLHEYLKGDKELKGILESMAQRNQVMFASALGSLALESDLNLPQEEVKEFIFLCQDNLAGWLLNRLKQDNDPVLALRIASLARLCSTTQVVPLVERLLDNLDQKASLPLLHRLAEIDEFRSINLLQSRFKHLDPSARELILRLLAKSKSTRAEDMLLKLAERSHWGEARLQDRLVALSSLAECGTSRSRELLSRLSKNWLFVFTGGGRKVRYMARSALEAIEVRRKKLLSSSSPEGREQ